MKRLFAVGTNERDPERWKGDAYGAAIAKELIVRAPKHATLLNVNHCPLEIFGDGMIESGAMSQIYMAAKLPVSLRAAVMPDAHSGYGLPIGGVLATNNVVIPFAVGVDIGCFTGETKVALADGRSVSFFDLINEQEKGIRHFGFSRRHDNSIVISELKNVRQTRTVNRLIEVVLDNGTSYRCTEDHVHYDVTGIEVVARDLQVGQSLFPLYINHFVVSLRVVDVESVPVYCLSEEENENFALASGVFVHNCRMRMTVFDVLGRKASGMRDMLSNVLKKNTVFGAGQDIDVDIQHPVLDDPRFDDIPRLKKANLKYIARKQIGTSGGGNHFVEFGVLTMQGMAEPMLAVLSHSGSRGMGNKIGLMYSDVAIQKCSLQNDAKRLAWLEMDDPDGQEYWAAMQLAGTYAEVCHEVIHNRIQRALGAKVMVKFENHHNFAWREKVDGKDAIVHRKGATPAGPGVVGVIPGSMTTATFVVEGKGDPRSMCSSSHGAGRAMSRKAAKEKYTMADLRENLAAAGVTLIGGSVDECSMSYKDIDAVMAAQSDLVDVKGRFLPMVVRMAEGQTKPWETE